METKGDRRRRKLTEMASSVDGGLSAIAERAECSVASLQQLIDVTPLPTKKDGTWSRKQMGDSTAERIEDAFKYPRGWFDTDAPTASAEDSAESHYPTLAQSVDVLAVELDKLPPELRAVAAERLAILAMAPDSRKAKQAFMAVLVTPDQLATPLLTQEERDTGSRIDQAARDGANWRPTKPNKEKT